MVTKEKCENALTNIICNIGVARSDYRTSGKAREDYHTLKSLIEEHFEMLNKLKTGDLSDGYHTYNELYHHRAVLFSVIINQNKEIAWKSKKHHDGTMYDGMFIVGIDTPQGQYSYHYDIDPYWNMFECKELDNAPVWDGHEPKDIDRLLSIDDNPPLKFEELEVGKPYWDNLKECWFIVTEYDPTSYYKYKEINWYLDKNDACYLENIYENEFDENRYYRKQVEE